MLFSLFFAGSKMNYFFAGARPRRLFEKIRKTFLVHARERAGEFARTPNLFWWRCENCKGMSQCCRKKFFAWA